MSRIGIAAAIVIAVIAGSASLGAQSLAPALPSVGPTFAAASISPRLAAPPAAARAMASSNSGFTNGEKLMILGGAALIAGAIIGDTPGTIIMIGGAAVGLYGLYLQLGRPHSGTPAKIGYAYTF